jgi:hypothetical protein
VAFVVEVVSQMALVTVLEAYLTSVAFVAEMELLKALVIATETF